MSTWLDLLNDIKQQRSADLLTPAQAQGYQQLCQRLTMPDWLNLCGPPGSGKTFLAWQVARAVGATYLPLPAQLDALDHPSPVLIVDNAPHQEHKLRNLLARCDLLNIPTVLLITRPRAMLPMPTVELSPPTQDDIMRVGAFVSRLGYFFQAGQLPPQPNFWDVLLASV